MSVKVALEAFERIKNKLLRQEGNTTYGNINDKCDLDIIEEELHRLEDLEK